MRRSRVLHPFPTRRSSDLGVARGSKMMRRSLRRERFGSPTCRDSGRDSGDPPEAGQETLMTLDEIKQLIEFLKVHDLSEFERSEEHTSELQSLRHLVCRLL